MLIARTITCPKCGMKNLWYADGNHRQFCACQLGPLDWESFRLASLPAQPAPPTVVHVSKDGRVRFPGRSDARPPKGFERLELRTLQERDRFERQYNQREQKRLERKAEIETQRREAFLKRHRQPSNISPELLKAAREVVDGDAPRVPQSRAYFEVSHFDASNRLPYTDRETNWKDKK